MRPWLSSLIAGLLFGLGLAISQMMDPAKVLGFLDLAGNWDPSLMLVMMGALAIYLPGYLMWVKPQLAGRAEREKSATASVISAEKPMTWHLPTKTRIDAPLVIGALLFGIGWGMVGLCPGPALASIGMASGSLALFLIAMLAGLAMVRLSQR
ncbi:YeeE/YedE family protein [Corallincola platygyrae]|uniref:YeeE/YedE family protein n=1 Tax=Corallincola platygyrae TaxID=1193278 RepID=A0ABW4XMN0_9GAMM